MHMSYRPIYYDTETTGIKSDRDKIIELAAYDPVRNLTFERLINPKCPIPKEATAIHSITDEMVKNVPSFEEVAKEFISFCSGETVLIAHNNDAFDKPFLEKEFKNTELQIPEWKFLDSLKWARKYRKDLPGHALQFLREVYGIEKNNAHRALDDVIVLEKVFSYMIGDLSLEVVMELMKKPQTFTRMPFGKHQGKHLKDVPSNYVAWLDESGALDKKDNEELKKSFIKLGMLK